MPKIDEVPEYIQLVIALSCGHKVEGSFGLNALPQVGDEMYCYECGKEERITEVKTRNGGYTIS